MTLQCQQAGFLGGLATSHQASKGGWVDKVVAETQAVHYDYTATFSTQRLSQVMPSYRALHHSQCCGVCTSTLQVLGRSKRSQFFAQNHVE